MKQEQILSTSDIEKLLDKEFFKFINKWHGVVNGPEMQTLSKFIGEVKEELNKPITNPA